MLPCVVTLNFTVALTASRATELESSTDAPVRTALTIEGNTTDDTESIGLLALSKDEMATLLIAAFGLASFLSPANWQTMLVGEAAAGVPTESTRVLPSLDKEAVPEERPVQVIDEVG